MFRHSGPLRRRAHPRVDAGKEGVPDRPAIGHNVLVSPDSSGSTTTPPTLHSVVCDAGTDAGYPLSSSVVTGGGCSTQATGWWWGFLSSESSSEGRAD